MADERYIDMMPRAAAKTQQESYKPKTRTVEVVGFGQYAPDRTERYNAPEHKREAYA
jgi:hypothetical protein